MSNTMVEIKVSKEKFKELISHPEVLSKFTYTAQPDILPVKIGKSEKVVKYFDYPPFRFVEAEDQP